ncbi:MAG: 4Fe-4S dicluster domain-containing protein [Acidobacteriota bacterium]
MKLRISLHCTHCGLCAAICPDGAITRRRRRIVLEASRCQSCRDTPACVSACPSGAIQQDPELTGNPESEPQP